MPKEDELSKVRKAIDSIDDQILSLLNERAELAISAGKTKTDSDIYKPARESLIFNRLTDMNKGPLNSCLLYTSPSPRDYAASRMPSSA